MLQAPDAANASPSRVILLLPAKSRAYRRNDVAIGSMFKLRRRPAGAAKRSSGHAPARAALTMRAGRAEMREFTSCVFRCRLISCALPRRQSWPQIPRCASGSSVARPAIRRRAHFSLNEHGGSARGSGAEYFEIDIWRNANDQIGTLFGRAFRSAGHRIRACHQRFHLQRCACSTIWRHMSAIAGGAGIPRPPLKTGRLGCMTIYWKIEDEAKSAVLYCWIGLAIGSLLTLAGRVEGPYGRLIACRRRCRPSRVPQMRGRDPAADAEPNIDPGTPGPTVDRHLDPRS